MPNYIIEDSATQDNSEINAGSPTEALIFYLDGYRTSDSKDEPAEAGKHYSDLRVFSSEDPDTCLKSIAIKADGEYGVEGLD